MAPMLLDWHSKMLYCWHDTNNETDIWLAWCLSWHSRMLRQIRSCANTLHRITLLKGQNICGNLVTHQIALCLFSCFCFLFFFLTHPCMNYEGQPKNALRTPWICCHDSTSCCLRIAIKLVILYQMDKLGPMTLVCTKNSYNMLNFKI